MDYTIFDTIVAIDVGLGGAIAMWRDGRITVVKMPRDLRELSRYIEYIQSISKNPIVFCEHVQMRPQDSQGGKQFGIVKMLKNYHQIETLIKSKSMPFIPVLPITWQTRLKIYIRGEDYQERKKRLKKISQDFHPELKVTLKTCDALLILRFARHMMQNETAWIDERFPRDYKLI